MPDLLTALRDQDLGFLRILAAAWGIPLEATRVQPARQDLAASILDAQLVEEVVAALPRSASEALSALVQETGRMPWPRFVQRFGAFRQMGPARRDRERPHEAPASPVEVLVYRGLVARAFFDTADGPQEFAYIPDDLLPLLPRFDPLPELPPGRPAADEDCASLRLVTDQLLDDLITLLAVLRIGNDPPLAFSPEYRRFIHSLIGAAGLVAPDGTAAVKALRQFLETPRAAAFARLTAAWTGSLNLSDLHHVPTLEVVGEWHSDPLRTRGRVLGFLASVPAGTWWSLPAFVAAIRDQHPDFQRPDGDFNSWLLRSRSDGRSLRGEQAWEEVEGALLRWLLTGPLHWLGLVDLAGRAHKKSEPFTPIAFRKSRWAARLLNGAALTGFAEEDQRVHVRSDGRINVPRLAPRAVRYLLARFCDWEAGVTGEYRYRPSPSSLRRASDQGLRVDQLIQLLARNTDGIPPNVTLALKNWQKHGQAARIETLPVLRLPSKEALEALRKSRAARFLGDTLGPAAVALKPGSEARVLAALVELGYLGEIVEI